MRCVGRPTWGTRSSTSSSTIPAAAPPSDSSSRIGSTRSARSCRRTPPSRSGPTPAAWAGSSSTRSSIEQGVHDLRELRLLNESLVKPALQSAGGVAEVASVGGLEKQYQVKLFPPLLSQRGISLAHVLSAVQGAFQEAGGRTIEVTNREYQLRGGVSSESIDKLEFLVLGRDRSGQPVQLKDVGYLQVGYDLRRGIADLDGTGEVVGGIAIMEQGRNVLAVTRTLLQKLDELKTSLPEGSRDRPDLQPVGADLGHADQLLPGPRLRADRRHPGHRRRA